MIRRHYFFSGYVSGSKPDEAIAVFDGVLNIKSLFQNPGKAWEEVRRQLAEAKGLPLQSERINIKTLARL